MMAKKTVFWSVGLQLLAERSQRMSRRELVAWCHVPCFLTSSGSSGARSGMQGSSSGSVRLRVVRPAPMTLAKVRPRDGDLGFEMS